MFIYSTTDMQDQGSNDGGGHGRGRSGRHGGTLSHAKGLASTTPLEELHTLSIRPSTKSSSVHSNLSTQAASTPSLPVGSTCDAPNPGCPLTTRQPAKNLYVSCYETYT